VEKRATVEAVRAMEMHIDSSRDKMTALFSK